MQPSCCSFKLSRQKKKKNKLIWSERCKKRNSWKIIICSWPLVLYIASSLKRIEAITRVATELWDAKSKHFAKLCNGLSYKIKKNKRGFGHLKKIVACCSCREDFQAWWYLRTWLTPQQGKACVLHIEKKMGVTVFSWARVLQKLTLYIWWHKKLGKNLISSVAFLKEAFAARKIFSRISMEIVKKRK